MLGITQSKSRGLIRQIQKRWQLFLEEKKKTERKGSEWSALERIIREICAEVNRSDLMNRALDYIREHFTSNDLSLDATAAHCGVSAAYLSRSFKNNMGIGYIDYVTELRMNEARKLLLNTSLSVSDISLRVGYIDVSSFRKKFRQVMGVSIQETREDQRKEDDPRKDD